MVAQLVKNPPAMQETPVGLLDWEDPLGKGYATHSVHSPSHPPILSTILFSSPQHSPVFTPGPS